MFGWTYVQKHVTPESNELYLLSQELVCKKYFSEFRDLLF